MVATIHWRKFTAKQPSRVGETFIQKWYRVKPLYNKLLESNKDTWIYSLKPGSIFVLTADGLKPYTGRDNYEFRFKSNREPSLKKLRNLVNKKLEKYAIRSNGYDVVIEGSNGQLYSIMESKEDGVMTVNQESIKRKDIFQFNINKIDANTREITNIATWSFNPYDDLSIGNNLKFSDDVKRFCAINSIFYCLTNNVNLKKRRNRVGKYLRHHIIEQFCIIKEFKSNVREKKHEYIKKVGITPNDILKWVKQFGHDEISLYIIDPLNNVFLDYHPKNALVALFIKVNNDHTYLISDSSKKAQLREKNRITNEVFFDNDKIYDVDVIQLDKLKDKIEKKDEKYIIINDSWMNVVNEYITLSNTMITEFNTSGDGISEFEDLKNDKIILIREDYEEVNGILIELNKYPEELYQKHIKYHGQSIGKIAIDLSKFFIGDIPKSSFNMNCLEYINQFKSPTLVESYDYQIPENVKKISYDINGAHSYAKCNLLDDIPIFEIHDTISKFDKNVDEVVNGLYHIEGFYLLKNMIWIPEGFYNNGFVNWLLDNQIISLDNIIEKYVATTKIDKNIFKNMTEFLFNKLSYKTAKILSNTHTGLQGRKYSKNTIGFFTQSNEMSKCMHKDGFYPISIKKDLYFTRKYSKTLLRKNNNPIYKSIIERSIVTLYDSIKKISNENTIITGIRTDAIYGFNFNKIGTTFIDKDTNGNFNKLGQLKIEKYNPPTCGVRNDEPVKITPLCETLQSEFIMKTQNDLENITFNVEREIKNDDISDDEKEDEKEDELTSCLIVGRAGVGKTYTIKNMTEKLKKLKLKTPWGKYDFKVISFTNKNVDNLKSYGIECAETIDKALFETNQDGERVCKYKNKELDFNVLFIDEIYNVHNHHLNTIYDLWLKNPELKIFAFGDKNQCPPVEIQGDNSHGVIYDYDLSQAFFDMFENKVELKFNSQKSRYDKKLYDASNDVLNNKIPKFKKIDESKCDRFLCKMNKTVDKKNMLIMNRIKGGDGFKLVKRKTGSASLLTNIKLEKGSPLVPYKNSKQFYNNEEFTYIKKDTKNVHLNKTSNNKTLILPIIDFQKNFIPCYAMTVNRCQGSKIDGHFMICDTHLMSKNLLYTAITRGTAYKYVHLDTKIKKIENVVYESCVKINIFNKIKKGYIYKIVNKVNNDFYIGQTTRTLLERFDEHKKMKKIMNTHQLNNMIKEYGVDNFEIEKMLKIHFIKQCELNKVERQYIKRYNPTYNKTKESKIPSVINVDRFKIKGLYFDKKRKMYEAKRRSKNLKIKKKYFSVKKYKTKENAYAMAFKYLTDSMNENTA